MRGIFEDELHEECAVFGCFNSDNLDTARIGYNALHAMQHRGQDGAGLAAADGDQIVHHKGIGLVSEVLTADKMAAFKNKQLIMGHVRYATSGNAHMVINTQPIVMHGRDGFMALAHNGHIVNIDEIHAELQNNGVLLQTSVDTEIFMHLIARETKNGVIEGIERMMKKVHGSYALVLITPERLIGVRDSYGIRPLALGQMGNSYFLASESCAFDAIGAKMIRDVRPGEIVWIDKAGLHSIQTQEERPCMCAFEYVYFARSDSIIDGIDVYNARLRMGETLSHVAPVEADIVSGVPESAIPAAIGYARESGIPYGQALVKNPYTGRTFIQPGQEARSRSVRMKLNVIKSQVEGKRIVLVDDSIVRGTNSLLIVEMLKQAGAKEVHMRIASPLVQHPCHYGINTPTASQLIGAMQTVEEIRSQIGADSLSYLSIPSLRRAISNEDNASLCCACFDGDYPIPVME